MADYTTRRTMMVDTQIRPSDVTKFPIIESFLAVPREAFVPTTMREVAYIGENLDLGGRVILDPRTLAKMLDALDIQPTEVVLDVACGLGYSTAVIARIADFVVGLEDDATRADEAQSILSEHGIDNAAIMTGDLPAGVAKSGPYDVVILQGAIEQFPDSLAAQVKEGGRVAAIFAEGNLGVVRVGYKLDGRINWRHAFNASAPVLAGFRKQTSFAL